MNRIKHFMILALALAMSLGAWAQQEVLLTTINASSGFTNGTQTFDNIVTVTLNDVSYEASVGWHSSGSPRPVEVAPVNGVTVTGYMLYFSITDPIEFEGSSFTVALEGFRVLADDISTQLGSAGITKIEVYGHQADASPTVTHNTDGSWGFTMPDYNAALNVTYYGQPALAWTLGGSAIPNDTTITAYYGFHQETMQKISFSMGNDFLTYITGLSSAEQTALFSLLVDSSSNPAVVAIGLQGPEVVGPGECDIYSIFRGNDDFLADTAAFHLTILDPDTLTLAADGNGTVSPLLGGLTAITTPDPSWTSNNDDVTASDLPGFQPMTRDEAIAFGAPSNEGSVYVLYTIEDGEFIGILWENGVLNNLGGSFRLSAIEGLGNAFNFYYTATGGTDIVATDVEGQYLVIHGAEVQVVAEAQDGNYVSAWSDNRQPQHYTSDTNTITVSGSMNLTATFAQNPLLTLATDGQGSVELDGVTYDTEEQSESFTTNQSLYTYTGQNFTITCTHVGDGDGIQIAYNQPITITSTNGQNITRVEFHMTYGHDVISTISSTPGTVVGDGSGTEGNCSITDINATSVSFSSSHSGYVQINQITVYSASIVPVPPDGVTAGTTANTFRVLPGTQLSVTATPGEGSYLAQWSDQTEPVEGDARLGSSHPYTMPATAATLTATFNEIPVLTLASNNSEWGTVELDGVTPGPTTYDITIEGGDTYTNVSFPFTTTVFIHEGLDGVEAVDQTPLIAVKKGDSADITINGPYGGTIEYSYNNHEGAGVKAIFCTAVEGLPIMPEGVVAYAGYGDYLVLPGTEVKVIATPDSAHYFVNWNEETALNSNTAVEKTLTMGTDDMTLTANFEHKPTLTVVCNGNEKGTMELTEVPQETLLTTINSSSPNNTFRSGSRTFDNIATVTFSGNVENDNNNWGWWSYSGNLTMTVSAAEGYTITRVKFFCKEGGAMDSQAPFQAILKGGNGYGPNTRMVVGNLSGRNGVTKIEVYGYCNSCPATHLVNVTDSTYLVDYGTTVRATATAKDGYHMDSWSNGAAVTDLLVNNNTITVTTDSTIRANFIANPLLTLASNNGEWGTVEMEGAGSGSSNGYTIKFSANGNTIVKENVTLPKTYQCEYGSPSEFDNIIRELYGWTGVHGNENAIPTVTGTDAITPGTESSNHYPKFTINSAFQGTATVTIGYTNSSWESDNWPIEISFVPALPAGVLATEQENVYNVLPGTTVTLTATAADALHHVQGWQNEDQGALAEAAYSDYFVTTPQNLFPAKSTLTLQVTGDTTATAMFGINSYDLTATVAESDDVRGTVSATYTDPQGAQQNAAAGASLTLTAQGGSTTTLTATPQTGYHFVGWMDNQNTQSALNTQNPLTMTEAGSYTAVFDTNVYQISGSVATASSQWGSVEGSGEYRHFTTATLEAVPIEHYHFVRWEDGNTQNPRIIDVTGEESHEAEFAIDRFIVEWSSNDETMGHVVGPYDNHTTGDPIPRLQGSYGTQFNLTASPTEHHMLDHWSTGQTSNVITVTITENAEIVAYFKHVPYNVTVASADETMGSVSGSQESVEWQASTEISATAEYGYHFVQWNDGNTANPRTVTINEEHDYSFTATFAKNQYTVTVVTGDATRGSVSGTTTVDYLTNVEISATANEHYHFEQWEDGNMQNPRTVTVTANATYRAYFAPDKYTVTGLADQGQGSVTGSGSYAYLSNATLTAEPACGYLFDHWSNESTESTITFQVTGDVSYTAFFRPAVVDTVEIHDTTVVTLDTVFIPVPDTNLVPVTVYDTTTVDVTVFDTTTVGVTVFDTTTVGVTVFDTTTVGVTVFDTTTVGVTVFDTTTVGVTVYDTTVTTVPVTVYDTTVTTIPVTVYDTTVTTIPVTVYDTTITTVPITVNDTTIVPVDIFDTTHVAVTVFDSTLVPITDTLWLTEYIYDTVYIEIHDTIYIHDTVFVGINDVDALDAKIYANNGQIVVEGADGNEVILFDVTGRILARKRDEYTLLRFDIPASGTYLVKIGNHAARRIVMIR